MTQKNELRGIMMCTQFARSIIYCRLHDNVWEIREIEIILCMRKLFFNGF